MKAAIPRNSTRTEIQLQGSFGQQEIAVVGRQANLGNGYRHFLLCPRCEKAYMSLYRRDFGQYACRRCLGLFYASSMRVEL